METKIPPVFAKNCGNKKSPVADLLTSFLSTDIFGGRRQEEIGFKIGLGKVLQSSDGHFDGFPIRRRANLLSLA